MPARRVCSLALAACLVLVSPGAARAADDAWTGEWVTDEGAMTLVQDGKRVTGSYGRGARVEGRVSGDALAGTYRAGSVQGTFAFEMQAGDRHFKGRWTHPNGNSRTWRGWKSDPEATSARGEFSGHWLTSIGTLRLEQRGKKVDGPWHHRGWARFEGTAEGRRLTGTLTKPTWSGSVWLELAPDGDRLFGLTDESPPAAVLAVRVEGFEPDPKLKAGETAKGVAENGMLYFVRPPDGWRKGKQTDAIVLLHGSNWTTAGMVHVTARNGRALADDYMIVGIQGDNWASRSEPDDLRFNYHYANWMGRSTYKGYPYTHRDSPQLVSDVIGELAEAHRWDRVFVGGHSQGAFLTYLLYMHFPEQIAGAFPMAGNVVLQAEPDVFDDEELKGAQRATPLAIVHGRRDSVVPFSAGLYVRDRFEAAGFPLLTLIAPDRGHPYDFLPVGAAVAWLDAMSTDDPKGLAAFAEEAADDERWRDVGAALVRAEALRAGRRLESVTKRYDAAARKEAGKYERLLEKGDGGAWVDDFFEWKRGFGRAPAAAETMAAYARLEAEHGPKAEALIDEAQAAFRQGDRATGRARWQEIVDRWFASGRYPMVRRWLED